MTAADLIKGQKYHVELFHGGRVNLTFNGQYGNLLSFTTSNGESWSPCIGHIKTVVAA